MIFLSFFFYANLSWNAYSFGRDFLNPSGIISSFFFLEKSHRRNGRSTRRARSSSKCRPKPKKVKSRKFFYFLWIWQRSFCFSFGPSAELIDFKTRRVAAVKKNLIELSELELKHANVSRILFLPGFIGWQRISTLFYASFYLRCWSYWVILGSYWVWVGSPIGFKFGVGQTPVQLVLVDGFQPILQTLISLSSFLLFSSFLASLSLSSK